MRFIKDGYVGTNACPTLSDYKNVVDFWVNNPETKKVDIANKFNLTCSAISTIVSNAKVNGINIVFAEHEKRLPAIKESKQHKQTSFPELDFSGLKRKGDKTFLTHNFRPIVIERMRKYGKLLADRSGISVTTKKVEDKMYFIRTN